MVSLGSYQSVKEFARLTSAKMHSLAVHTFPGMQCVCANACTKMAAQPFVRRLAEPALDQKVSFLVNSYECACMFMYATGCAPMSNC